MGFDHLLNTGLVLGLGFSPTPVGEHMPKRPAHPASSLKLEPSLTLTLSGETFEPPPKPPGSDRNQRKIADPRRDNHLCVQDSAASSLSNFSSVKRDREQGSEEVEIERAISSRISDERDDGSNGRKKLRLSKAQSAILEESFKQQSTLNPQQKQDLAKELKLQARQVEVWFQNRRARTKLKQTEMDCEIMKKCCESLTDENRRLQKEIRALKMAQPLYVQLPAATLTLCPSCERISGGGSDDAPKRTAAFAITAKPHFYSPFTNSSAAC